MATPCHTIESVVFFTKSNLFSIPWARPQGDHLESEKQDFTTGGGLKQFAVLGDILANMYSGTSLMWTL